MRALSLAATAAVAAASCATPFDPTREYFADAASRFQPTHATTFSITYGRSYKKVNVTTAGSGTKVVALRVCGAPAPTNADLGVAAGDTSVLHLELPLTRAAVLSTTQLPWLEVSASWRARGRARKGAAGDWQGQ
jgi:hypothetical protein